MNIEENLINDKNIKSKDIQIKNLLIKIDELMDKNKKNDSKRLERSITLKTQIESLNDELKTQNNIIIELKDKYTNLNNKYFDIVLSNENINKILNEKNYIIKDLNNKLIENFKEEKSIETSILKDFKITQTNLNNFNILELLDYKEQNKSIQIQLDYEITEKNNLVTFYENTITNISKKLNIWKKIYKI